VQTRTFIVDDEDDMRLLLRATIEMANQGLVVSGEASDGQTAVAMWREIRPDVMILDHRMPGLTGLEAAETILAEDPQQKIVLFTAYLNDDAQRRAEAIGVRACLSKDDLFRLPEVLWSFATPN
jgi:DNA-binding NarL/FixJ family response regulator